MEIVKGIFGKFLAAFAALNTQGKWIVFCVLLIVVLGLMLWAKSGGDNYGQPIDCVKSHKCVDPLGDINARILWGKGNGNRK